jgi:hypothetical protein
MNWLNVHTDLYSVGVKILNKEEHNNLLYKIIALERLLQKGYTEHVQRETLRILAKLVTEIYDTQNSE